MSIILASNRPANLTGFLDNLERTAADPGSFEVLVKADAEDGATLDCLRGETERRRFTLRHIATPRGEGYYGLHRGYQTLFEMSHPGSYFISVFTDELRWRTLHWDRVLARYVRLFPDDIFRLRISENRARNYYAMAECLSRPENYALTTRRWYEVTEGIGDFWGPDSWHQCIEYYLGQCQIKGAEQGIFRGVPVDDLKLDGETAGIGWSGEVSQERIRRIEAAWRDLDGYDAHARFYRLAIKLVLQIWFAQQGRRFDLRDDAVNKTFYVYDGPLPEHTVPVAGFPYQLPAKAYIREVLPRLLELQYSRFVALCDAPAWAQRDDLDAALECFTGMLREGSTPQHASTVDDELARIQRRLAGSDPERLALDRYRTIQACLRQPDDRQLRQAAETSALALLRDLLEMEEARAPEEEESLKAQLLESLRSLLSGRGRRQLALDRYRTIDAYLHDPDPALHRVALSAARGFLEDLEAARGPAERAPPAQGGVLGFLRGRRRP